MHMKSRVPSMLQWPPSTRLNQWIFSSLKITDTLWRRHSGFTPTLNHFLETPFGIYADFESILEQVDDDESKSTRKINKHVPCGFSCFTTSSCKQYNREVVVYSGRDSMSKFFQHIHSEQLRISKILNDIVPMKELTPQQIRDYRNAKKCSNCDVEFSADQNDKNYAKHRHHNHLDGLYLGSASVWCNLLMKYKQATRPKKNKPATYEIPIFFHNLRGMSLNMVSMNQIYNALVLSRIQYALPAYYGFLLQADKDRIDALMQKAKRWALTSLTISIDVLAQSVDSTLFSKAVQPEGIASTLLSQINQTTGHIIWDQIMYYITYHS